MNPDTRVAICCYAGDAHQITEMLDLYKHHECPITILSPEDSPVLLPGLDCRAGGKRAYIGQLCLDRMVEHFKILLAYPENHFLIHDSDSICLSPELPAYLYAEPDLLWSNTIKNTVREQQHGFPRDIPRVAFQPPWFLSRKTIERILATGAPVENPVLPFIDYWLVEAATRHKLPYRALPTAISTGTADPATAEIVRRYVAEEGLIFIHSVKNMAIAAPLIEARKQYLARSS